MSPAEQAFRRYFIAGGAGFIGSHFTDRLLGNPEVQAVTLYDNFSSGQEWHYAHHLADPRLRVIRGDVKDLPKLRGAMENHEVAILLASNPDIAKAMTDPSVDFHEGTLLTHCVVEAMRQSGCHRLLYASGSGVYGELGTLEAKEDHGPLRPISTYGASKLAGEALLSAYTYMFGLSGCAFRFGNVVGPRQTHGVGFAFVRKLRADPTRLRILGDGSQSKSYIHIHDIVDAVMLANERTGDRFQVYNVATGDYITAREIAELAVARLGLDVRSVRFEFTGGDRGWKGDVPVVRIDTTRIRSLGWKCSRTSSESLSQALDALIGQMSGDAVQ